MKKLFALVLSYLPTRLPVGRTAHDAWAKDILDFAQVPDNDSTRFAVAVMIMHLGSTTDRKPKQYFIRALNKSAANEVANAVCIELKEKQQAAMKAQEEAKAVTQGISGNASAKVERN